MRFVPSATDSGDYLLLPRHQQLRNSLLAARVVPQARADAHDYCQIKHWNYVA